MILEKLASIPDGIRNVTAVTPKVRSTLSFFFVSHFLCLSHVNKIAVCDDVTVFVFSKCFFNLCQISITDTTVADVVNQTASLLLQTNTLTPKDVVKLTGILDGIRNVNKTAVTPQVRSSSISSPFSLFLAFLCLIHVSFCCCCCCCCCCCLFVLLVFLV